MIEIIKPIIIIGGASGAGKGTIIKEVLNKFPQALLSVSVTTRTKRDWETEGLEYYFKDKKEFLKLFKENAFFESVDPDSSQSEEFYGTLWSEIKRINDQEMLPILDVDLHGIFKGKEVFKNMCLSLYIYTDFNSRNRRLVDRGDIKDPRKLNIRLEKGQKQDELSFSSTFKGVIDHHVINEDNKLDEACNNVFSHIDNFLINLKKKCPSSAS